jgi:antitoxin (DNA-binding transcriptional repressor) of toxin-antitoxin stability system
MSTVTLDIAQANLSTLIDDAVHGKEVLIAKDNKTYVKLVPVAPSKPHPVFGSAKGLITMSDDFDAPLEDFENYAQ